MFEIIENVKYKVAQVIAPKVPHIPVSMALLNVYFLFKSGCGSTSSIRGFGGLYPFTILNATSLIPFIKS